MEDYQVYQDPPRANLFFNPVPRRGFRLVSFGDMIPIDDVAMFPGSVPGCYVVAVERGKKYTKEFAINLTTEDLVFATDYCGVKSGRDIDKFKEIRNRYKD